MQVATESKHWTKNSRWFIRSGGLKRWLKMVKLSKNLFTFTWFHNLSHWQGCLMLIDPTIMLWKRLLLTPNWSPSKEQTKMQALLRSSIKIPTMKSLKSRAKEMLAESYWIQLRFIWEMERPRLKEVNSGSRTRLKIQQISTTGSSFIRIPIDQIKTMAMLTERLNWSHNVPKHLESQ